MSIPLVQNNEKDSINTSIIAIKRNIERINMLLGLSNSEEIDTSEFVKKSDIVDVVEAGNMNPVTSNAVVPVDEVAVDNMHSVSSNAVAESLSYSTTEQKTGGKWIDGKPIYRNIIEYGNGVTSIPASVTILNNVNIDRIIKWGGFSIYDNSIDYGLPIDLARIYNYHTSVVYTEKDMLSKKVYIILEYTKTTD